MYNCNVIIMIMIIIIIIITATITIIVIIIKCVQRPINQDCFQAHYTHVIMILNGIKTFYKKYSKI